MLRSFSRFQLCDTMDCSPPDSSVSPSRNTGMGCRALFQGLFPTQGSNPSLLHLLHCRFFSLMPQGKPQIDYSLIQTLQLELRHQVAQERCQDIEIPFLSSQDPGAHFFFFNAKVIMRYNQSSLGILQLWLSPTIPKKEEIFFHFQVFSWNCRLSLIKKQKVGAWFKIYHYRDFPGGSEVKTLPSNARDVGSIPGQARIPCDLWPKN